jgi:hypothetical protein
MRATLSWIPSPSQIAVAQDLNFLFNGISRPTTSVGRDVSSYEITGVNESDSFEIYIVTYGAGGSQRAVSEHLTGIVPRNDGVVETLLPATGLSISFRA